MYNSDENQSRKSIYVVIAVIFAVVLVIITISVLITNLAPREEANIVNQTNVVDDTNSTSNPTSATQSTNLLSEEQLSMVKKELYGLLSNTASADHDFDAAIRWDTIKTSQGIYPTTSFLVDIDEYQQTYRVTLDQDKAELRCPKLGESKYPQSFCIGNTGEYDDSINIVFGDSLPYSGKTSAGEYFSISRNDIEDMESISDRYLEILLYACPFDDAAVTRANQAVDDVLTSLGAPTDLFEREILSGGGCNEN